MFLLMKATYNYTKNFILSFTVEITPGWPDGVGLGPGVCSSFALRFKSLGAKNSCVG